MSRDWPQIWNEVERAVKAAECNCSETLNMHWSAVMSHQVGCPVRVAGIATVERCSDDPSFERGSTKQD